MNFAILFDGPSAAIVLGGTALATVLRCGFSDVRTTAIKLGSLWQKPFDAAETRAALAGQVREIQSRGLIGAQLHHMADREFEEATDALIGHRSVSALLDRHEAHRARRQGESERAVNTLTQAAELAPVFGLAGTLVALSQLPTESLVRGAFTGAIAMAVVTTLYGLLAGNLLFSPLALILERRANAEERERQSVIDWLAAQVAPACPTQGATAPRAVA